jgi:hypothetical protein
MRPCPMAASRRQRFVAGLLAKPSLTRRSQPLRGVRPPTSGTSWRSQIATDSAPTPHSHNSDRASLVQVQSWMGHAHIQITARYLHAKSQADDAALLAGAFAASGSPAEVIARAASADPPA